MRIFNFRMALALFALGVLALVATVSTEVRAQAAAVDPAATRILQRMTDYLGSLQQFRSNGRVHGVPGVDGIV